ncbi:ATP-binding protein [Pseudomonas alliivorans]|uniref:AlbA family DNA-binding domain-containing protein n=1 Tax=Pseudomonas fragariae (ex Marin et al. 2024) TaxID=3080056 RepID=UPI002ECC6D38|nr:ATP-binding protein [Pseudomonas alliivorans]MEE5126113.1 ATP-binding protein [Pseudomonas alliivorans]
MAISMHAPPSVSGGGKLVWDGVLRGTGRRPKTIRGMISLSLSKPLHHSFTEFFARPTKETLRSLLKLSVGETNNVDFKEVWPEKAKLAKHVLALANTQGGILVIGVADGSVLASVGLQEFKDKTDVGKQLSPYIPSNLAYEVFDFEYDQSENSELTGKKFQVLMVESNNQDLPYMAIKSAEDLKNNAVYIRKDCASTEAGYSELQELLDARIATQDAAKRLLDLEEHCEQLKVLYAQTNESASNSSVAFLLGSTFRKHMEKMNALAEERGVKDSFKVFMKSCIEKKKARIERELDI